MKKILTILSFFLCLFVNAQNAEKDLAIADSLTPEERGVLLEYAESVMLDDIDSIAREGMYLNALERLDNLRETMKNVVGVEPSSRFFLLKTTIYMEMSEWQKMVETTTECINLYKDTMNDQCAAMIYNMQGFAYQHIDEYYNAIHSYENSLHYYSHLGRLEKQGDTLCRIAYCYSIVGKKAMGSLFYEKGLTKFLEYFNTTKMQLLQSELTIEDSEKESFKRTLGSHLFFMAMFEESDEESKKYLLMSVHCGNDAATSEYQRIFGY